MVKAERQPDTQSQKERHVGIDRHRDSQTDKLLDTIRLNSHALDNFLH